MARFCPSCGNRYGKRETICPQCNVALEDEDSLAASIDSSEPDDVELDAEEERGLVVVYRSSPMDSEMIRALLDDNGIAATTTGEGYRAAYPINVGALGERRVLVRAEDAERARALIEAAERGEFEVSEDEAPEEPTRMMFLEWAAPLITAVAIVLVVLTLLLGR